MRSRDQIIALDGYSSPNSKLKLSGETQALLYNTYGRHATSIVALSAVAKPAAPALPDANLGPTCSS